MKSFKQLSEYLADKSIETIIETVNTLQETYAYDNARLNRPWLYIKSYDIKTNTAIIYDVIPISDKEISIYYAHNIDANNFTCFRKIRGDERLQEFINDLANKTANITLATDKAREIKFAIDKKSRRKVKVYYRMNNNIKGSTFEPGFDLKFGKSYDRIRITDYNFINKTFKPVETIYLNGGYNEY